jgi:tRNA(Ile2) C34 agmatinyltransferase TiaS
MFQAICPECGRMSFGWGYRCRYCMADMRIDKVECYIKIRDYEEGNE